MGAPPLASLVFKADIERVYYSICTLLIYDHLLTLSEEIQYVWRARWSVIKIVFLTNRYLSPVVIGMGILDRSGIAGLTDYSCRAWLIAEYVMGYLILSLASFITVFRLHAARPKRSVLVPLAFIWISTNAASLTIGLVILFCQRQRQHIYYESAHNMCIFLVPGLWKLQLPNVVSHVAFLVVLFYTVLGTPRSSKSPILRLLLKDGIIYYSVVLVALLQTVIILAFVDWTNHLPFHLGWATCAGQVSRFLLSLKTAQHGLPFQQRHDTLTAHQIVLGDMENHSLELSPFQETPRRGQTRRTSDELAHHRVNTDHDKVPPTPLTATSGARRSTRQQTGGWFVRFFREPPRHRHVEVDADAASCWVEGEDRGPGMQESKIGRYDAWL